MSDRPGSQAVQDLRTFLKEYEAAFNRFDARAIARAYAPSFLMSDGHHEEPLRNDETLLEGILRAGEFYKHLGVASVRLTPGAEESIDDTHALLKTHWNLLKQNGDELVDFDSAYVVRRRRDTWEIILVIATDEEKQMRAKGLLPS